MSTDYSALLEKKILELKIKNDLLSEIARTVRSYPSDCDLVANVGGFELLYGMYEGCSVLSPGKDPLKDWEKFDSFDKAFEHILSSKLI